VGRGRGWRKGRGLGKGEEMTQTLYAHMNKRNKKNHDRHLRILDRYPFVPF
jgi:hypothetical protein